jgi:putative nucleotidyltransferase with HDIG domain
MDCKAIDYKHIPVRASVISEVMRLDVESASCFRELESHVGSDLGVTTMVLRVANSAFYNRGKEIANIPRAISVLGFNVVRSLAILAFGRSLFAQSRDTLFQRHIWHHSLLTALAGRAICLDIGDDKDKDEAFIAGLMHDVGKVLLFTHQQDRYFDVLALVLDQGYTSVAAEQEIFGCDHLQVGREAVAQWKLPERFADFMASELSIPKPEFAADPVRLSLACANYLIASGGIGARPIPEIDSRKSTLAAFGLKTALCDEVLQDEFMAGLMNDDIYRLCATI